MQRLFCGNLNFDTTEPQLSQFFSDAGFEPTKVQIIRDKETEKSRGFGFIELSSIEAGESAIAALHQQKLHGRTVIVSEARPKPDAASRSRQD